MKTIRIDEELCDGCGDCITACHEGALELVDGKARLVRTDHCDGLGDCVGECPRGAIAIVDRADDAMHAPPVATQIGAMAAAADGATAVHAPSELTQWPVQLHLVPPNAPYFRGADLLLAADCAAFAHGGFHSSFLRGRALAIACPKLDDPSGYVEKLAAMMGEGGVRSVTVLMMEVPCCRGLERLVTTAMQSAGRSIPARRVILGIDGGTLADQPIE